MENRGVIVTRRLWVQFLRSGTKTKFWHWIPSLYTQYFEKFEEKWRKECFNTRFLPAVRRIQHESELILYILYCNTNYSHGSNILLVPHKFITITEIKRAYDTPTSVNYNASCYCSLSIYNLYITNIRTFFARL